MNIMKDVKNISPQILFALCLGLIIISVAYVPHIQNSFNLWIFNDDIRQHIAPLYSYYDSELFQNDYISQACRACFLPSLYKVFFKLTALVLDPYLTAALITYVLIFLFIVFVSLCAKEIAGWTGFYVTLLLVSTNCIYIERIVGGMPRSFALPVAAFALWALMKNKPLLLCILIVLLAGFYPFLLPVWILILFLSLFFLESLFKISWTTKQKVFVLLLVLFLVICLVLPYVYGLYEYGGFSFDSSHSGGGSSTKKYIGKILFDALDGYYGKYLFYAKDLLGKIALNKLFLAFTFFTFINSFLKDEKSKKLLLFIVVSLLLAFISGEMFHNALLEKRLLRYSFIVFTPLILVHVIKYIFELVNRSKLQLKEKNKTLLLLSIVLVSFIGISSIRDHLPSRCGLIVRISTKKRALYQVISTLPKDVVIAGWPGGVIDNIPLLSKRAAFITRETDRSFISNLNIETNKRMQAFLSAYFSDHLEPLIRLNKNWNVNYLIVNRKHFSCDTPPEVYKKKYQEYLDRNFKCDNVFILGPLDDYKIYSDEKHFILDLNRLVIAYH